MSTQETNLGYIRRTIKPALGAREVRKVRGPLLDNLYARLPQCGNLACARKTPKLIRSRERSGIGIARYL